MSVDRLKILVIDDCESDRYLLRRFLKKVGDHYPAEVHEAENGKAATELCDAIRFDLIICDYRLTETEGTEVVARIGGSQRNKATPIIMATGYATSHLEAQAIALGARALIPKENLCAQTVADLLARFVG